MGSEVIDITSESAERLVIAADLAIRDGSNDTRCQSLALMSIAISLHQLATLLGPSMREQTASNITLSE